MDSLPGVMWHLSDAWARRGQPNIVLVHYQDLSADLDGEMRRLVGTPADLRAHRDLARPRAGGHVSVHAGQLRSGFDRAAHDHQGQQGVLPARHLGGRPGQELSAAELADYQEAGGPAGPAGPARSRAAPGLRGCMGTTGAGQ